MKSTTFILLMAAAGIAIGFAASTLVGGGQTECKEIEEGIRANQSFPGTVACFPPGALDINASSQVSNLTEAKCVCRRSFEGEVQYFLIKVAS